MPGARNNTLTLAAGALVMAGAAWPWVVGAASALFLSPYERAVRAAWCGVAPHAQWEMLGHCPACWAGSAAFLGAAVVLMHAGLRSRLAISLASVR